MIMTIVTFQLSKPTTLAEITKTFQSTAPKYRGIPGLLRKNYWVSEDGRAPAASISGRHAPTPSACSTQNGASSAKKNTASRRASNTCMRR
jgi:hypothetical protein